MLGIISTVVVSIFRRSRGYREWSLKKVHLGNFCETAVTSPLSLKIVQLTYESFGVIGFKDNNCLFLVVSGSLWDEVSVAEINRMGLRRCRDLKRGIVRKKCCITGDPTPESRLSLSVSPCRSLYQDPGTYLFSRLKWIFSDYAIRWDDCNSNIWVTRHIYKS